MPDSDVPRPKDAPIKDSIPSLHELLEKIDQADRAVDQIPTMKISPPDGGAEFNGSEMRRTLRNVIADTRARVESVAKLHDVQYEVREVIIDPVNKLIERVNELIQKAHRSATTIGIVGVIVGLVGLAPAFEPWWQRRSVPVGSIANLTNPSQQSGLPGGEPTAEQIEATADGGTSASQLAKVMPAVKEFESFVLTKAEEARDYTKCRHAPDQLLDSLKGISDPEAKAAGAYELIVCASRSGDWQTVASLADLWGTRNPSDKQKKYLGAAYGFAIRVYGAEAIVHTESIDAALNQYQKLSTESVGANTRPFLSPTNPESVDGKELVALRVTELALQKDLSKSQIWIYDMGDGARANEVASTLRNQDHRLDVASAKTQWDGKKTSRPWIYYRNGPNRQKMGQSLESMIFNVVGRVAEVQDYTCCKRDDIQSQFDENHNLEFLVLLPLGAKSH